MQRVVIPLSKSKMVFLLLIACAFVALGWWMFAQDAAEIEAQRRFNSPLFVHGVGLFNMVCFGLVGALMLRKLFDPSPGLVVDDRGLTDNTSAFSAGFVPWSDITGFEVRQIQRQRVLYVRLKDPEKYIARFSPIRRKLFRASERLGASPVTLTSSSMAIGFDEMVKLVNQGLAGHRLDS